MSEWANMLALAAILLIGVPHGAADVQLAVRGRLLTSNRSMLLFVVGYLALTGLVVGFWLALPIIALPAFFLLSAYHFGRGDGLARQAKVSAIVALAHGGGLALIPLFHTAEVTPILAYLTDLDGALFQPFFIGMAIVWSGCVAFAAFNKTLGRTALLEIIAIAALFTIVPPLPAFAIYFTAIHSRRHFARLFAIGLNNSRDWVPAALIAAFSVVAIAVAAALMEPTQLSSGLVKALFIALAGLTVPHMLLVDGADIFARIAAAGDHHARQ